MLISDIKRVVDQVSRDKGIDRNILFKALEEALRSAAKKKLGNKTDIEVQYSEETGEIEVFQFKEVVEDRYWIRNLKSPWRKAGSLIRSVNSATVSEPRWIPPLSAGLPPKSAKQVIIQKMKDAEKDAIYAGYIDRKGEIINGIVQRFDRGDIIVNLGNTEGILPRREQVPREAYRRGDRIRAYIMDVLHDTKGPQILLSRTHPNFLVILFKTEVPEISEGIVTSWVLPGNREAGLKLPLPPVIRISIRWAPASG